MKEVEFIKDFANRKKGDVWACDSMLARTLINEGVAKFYVKEEKKKAKK